MKICIAFITFLLLSCQHKKQTKEIDTSPELIIAIQPLGDVSIEIIKDVQNVLWRHWNIATRLLEKRALPLTAYNANRKRYKASLLLDSLDNSDIGTDSKIVGITDFDIETKLHDKDSWGIMGLAKLSGKACVVSTYRVKKYTDSKKRLIELMTILFLHELGHTFSQNHCSDQTCIMQDAEGGMRLDDSKGFCNACSARLRRNKFLH